MKIIEKIKLFISSQKKLPFVLFLILLATILLIVTFLLFSAKKPPLEEKKGVGGIGEEVSSVVKNFEALTAPALGEEQIAEMGDKAEEVIKLGETAVDPLLLQLSHQNIKVRWLAVYALARLGHEVSKKDKEKIAAAFQKFVAKEESLALKRQAATALVSFGDKEAIPLLIECLSGDEVLLFSEPPKSLDEFCLETLKFYTAQNFDYDQSLWQDWWQKNKEGLKL